MSLGVCLPGGGAKGAFQAGVLEALYNRGIKNFGKSNIRCRRTSGKLRI